MNLMAEALDLNIFQGSLDLNILKDLKEVRV